jgi:hypothetical protein
MGDPFMQIKYVSNPMAVIMSIPRGIIVLCMFITFLLGCNDKKNRDILQGRTLDQSDMLNRCYLTGTVVNARLCLQENAQLIERADVLEPIGRAQILTSIYAHLFVLESRAGKGKSAEANLIKTKFWVLKRIELEHGDIEAAMTEIEDMNFSNTMAVVDETDRKHNQGKLPAYILEATNSVHEP